MSMETCYTFTCYHGSVAFSSAVPENCLSKAGGIAVTFQSCLQRSYSTVIICSNSYVKLTVCNLVL